MKLYCLLIFLYLIAHPIKGQDGELFVMDNTKEVTSCPLLVKNFSNDTSKTFDDKEVEIKKILNSYHEMDYQTAERIYTYFFFKNRCHKFFTQITTNTFKEECRFPLDSISYTDVSELSGRSFVHVANLDIRTLEITVDRYDIDIAMVLRDSATSNYHYWLPKCSDTPHPFTYALNQEITYVKKYFLIAFKSESYKMALECANTISKTLNLELRLIHLSQFQTNKKLSKKQEEVEEYYDNYWNSNPRGIADDGNYVSIEFSSSYKSLKPGYYFVTIASQTEKSKTLLQLFEKTKKSHPQARLERLVIYEGCLD